jgi:hypothetical protein
MQLSSEQGVGNLQRVDRLLACNDLAEVSAFQRERCRGTSEDDGSGIEAYQFLRRSQT